MRRYLAALLAALPAALLAALLAAAGGGGSAAIAQPTVHARVADTQPAARATLGRNETFYVRIEYTSDDSVRLWARPFFHGKAAPAMANPSRSYIGSGSALGWFAFREAADVDEVRITAGGGTPYREWLVASYPVRLHWTTVATEPLPVAPWVAEMRAADRAAERAEMQRKMNEPMSPGDDALASGLIALVFASIIGGIVAPVLAFRKWRGGWRIAVAAPLALMGFVVVRAMIDTAVDPTSHNLWPLELGMFALLGLAITGGLALLRLIAGVNRG